MVAVAAADVVQTVEALFIEVFQNIRIKTPEVINMFYNITAGSSY